MSVIYYISGTKMQNCCINYIIFLNYLQLGKKSFARKTIFEKIFVIVRPTAFLNRPVDITERRNSHER